MLPAVCLNVTSAPAAMPAMPAAFPSPPRNPQSWQRFRQRVWAWGYTLSEPRDWAWGVNFGNICRNCRRHPFAHGLFESGSGDDSLSADSSMTCRRSFIGGTEQTCLCQPPLPLRQHRLQPADALPACAVLSSTAYRPGRPELEKKI